MIWRVVPLGIGLVCLGYVGGGFSPIIIGALIAALAFLGLAAFDILAAYTRLGAWAASLALLIATAHVELTADNLALIAIGVGLVLLALLAPTGRALGANLILGPTILVVSVAAPVLVGWYPLVTEAELRSAALEPLTPAGAALRMIGLVLAVAAVTLILHIVRRIRFRRQSTAAVTSYPAAKPEVAP